MRIRPLPWSLRVAAWLLVTSSCGAAESADSSPTDLSSADWPSIIARLQQQLYDWPGHVQTRQQLAIARNNYGVSLTQQEHWESAEREFREALRLERTNQQVLDNFTQMHVQHARHAYQHHEIREALQALESATALNPNFAPAYALRGEIQYYGAQNLKEAKAAWQRAFELDPAQPGLADQLARVTRELPVESKFERLSQAYFDVRYEEQLEAPVGFDVRDALLEARRTIGADFAYWPKHKIVVLLYSAESFRALRQETPEWVKGEFEARLQGKIRIPLPSAQLDQASVKSILFHEYTHAILHDLTMARCPTWLNEGFAEYEGARYQARTLTRLAAAFEAQRTIAWHELSEHFSSTHSLDEIQLAYEQAYSITSYLAQRYTFWRLRRMLAAIVDGTPWEEAMTKEFRMSLSRLEQNWRQWLPTMLANPSQNPSTR